MFRQARAYQRTAEAVAALGATAAGPIDAENVVPLWG
jgi:hypothetical protein